MLILCSKSPKMRVSKAKSAQKPRFCARNARKRGVRRQKAHKNADFVLERPENRGSRPQKRTKTPILCSKCPKTRVSNPQKAQKCRFRARKARKRGCETKKKHKNGIFVLGTHVGTQVGPQFAAELVLGVSLPLIREGSLYSLRCPQLVSDAPLCWPILCVG